MNYEISESKLSTLLEKAGEVVAKRVLTELGLNKNQVSQRQAYLRYGQGRVTRWRNDGKIKPNKSGGKIYYSLNDLDRLKGINELFYDTPMKGKRAGSEKSNAK